MTEVSCERMNNLLTLRKNFDGWAKMSDGWANALPCLPLVTPMFEAHLRL